MHTQVSIATKTESTRPQVCLELDYSSRGVAPSTTLRTPARQLLQIGLKKEQPYQHFPLHAFPADASR